MRATKNHTFYDFGTFEHVPGSHNQYYLFLETPGNHEKNKSVLKIIMLEHFKFFWFRKGWHVRNRRAQEKKQLTIRLIDSWKSWIWD